MHRLTPPDTFMRRLLLLATALIFAFTWNAHALSISIDANLLKDASGNPMPTTGLVLLVASTNDSTFNPPTPLNFVTGDDVIVGAWDLSAFGEPGVLSDFVNTTVPVSGSNPLQLYWYPTLTLASTAPGQGTPYGTYRSDVSLDKSDPWFGSSPSATITLKFLTADANTGYDDPGSNPAAAGNASSVTPTLITINTQPASTTQTLGSTANFSVNASGSSLTYKWRKNGVNLSDGANVSGSATANLTIANVSTNDAANYSVVVANTQAAVASSDATLTFDDLTITAGPASFTAACGSVWPCLSVTASASSGVTYQWYTPDINGAAIANATNATLCLNNTFASAGNYTVLVTSGLGSSMASAPATVTVVDTTAPAITLNGAPSVNICKGSPYNEVGATAADSCDGSVVVNVSGSVDNNTVGTYTVTYTASDSHGNTGAAYRTVNVESCDGASISVQPQSQSVNYSATLTLSVTAHPDTATYQWNFNGSAISGATNSIFTKANMVDTDAGSYTVDVTAGTTVSSDPAVVTVLDPGIITQPLAQIVTNGQKNVQITLQAAGTGTLKYQWYEEGVGLLAHKTNYFLTFPKAAVANNGTYYCIVTGPSSTAESSHVALNVYYPPVAAITPALSTKTAGNVAQFKVVASPSQAVDPSKNLGGPVTFYWLKNGSHISTGGNIKIVDTMNTSLLTIFNVQQPDQGTYQCIVSNLASSTTTPSTKGILGVTQDSHLPLAAILHPSNGMRFTNGLPDYVGGGHTQNNLAPELDIDGSASDNGYITNVTLIRTVPPGSLTANVDLTYRMNAAGLILPGHVLWTNHVTLVPGTNTFVAITSDSGTNNSVNNTARTYYYFVNGTVTINVSPANPALGKVNGTPTFGIKPVAGVNQLPIAMGFKLTAVPNMNKHFDNWTDGNGQVLGTTPTLCFKVTDGMVINANFH